MNIWKFLFGTAPKPRTVLLIQNSGENKIFPVERTQCGWVGYDFSRPFVLMPNGVVLGRSWHKGWAPVSGWTEEDLLEMGMTPKHAIKTATVISVS